MPGLLWRLRRALREGSRTGRRHSRGQGLVELALVTPLLLLVFAAAADLGRAFYAYVAIENAVKEGAFFGSRSPLCDDDSAPGCADPDNVLWRVRNELQGVRNADGTELTPTISCIDPSGVDRGDPGDCLAGDTYAVGLIYPFRLITPILGSILSDHLDLKASSTAVVLNVAFDPSPGASTQKLVSATGAINGSQIAAKCLEPDDTDGNGFYRSPCRDTSTPDPTDILHMRFEGGDPITYKILVRNSGAVTLTGLSINDSLGWPSTCPTRPTSLATSGEYFCQYVRIAPTTTGADPDFEYVNQLTVDADQVNPTVDAITAVVRRPPAQLRVLKWVSPYKLGQDGDGIRSDGIPSFGTIDALSIGFDATIPTPTAWYKVIVTNIGGVPASPVTISDSFGPLPFGRADATAVCDDAPTTLAPGESFECRYRRTFNAAGTFENTVTATSTDPSVVQTDDATASVTVAACSGTDRVVPSLIGSTKSVAQTTWTAAGFTTALGVWGGQNGATVVTQNKQAFACMPQSTSMNVTRVTTPP